jgi:hypothetical protein
MVPERRSKHNVGLFFFFIWPFGPSQQDKPTFDILSHTNINWVYPLDG